MATPAATSSPTRIETARIGTASTELAGVPPARVGAALGSGLSGGAGDAAKPGAGDADAADGVDASDGVGAAAAEAVGATVGVKVGAGVAALVGAAVGAAVGRAVGLTVGFGVGLAVGAGVAPAWTTIVPNICSGWTWQKYGNVPALLKVTWNEPPGSLIPESKRPSGDPGTPEVTVCGSPEKVQPTTSPMLTVRDCGWNRKFIAATVTVDASTEPATRTEPATSPMSAAMRKPVERRGSRLNLSSAIAR